MEAKKTVEELKQLLGNIALDIQHIGSTAIPLIHAKPIIDIVVGVGDLGQIIPFIEKLNKRGFVFRGEDVSGQFLFIKGNVENDVRTHHIHIVKWNEVAWNNYINFRDFLNADPKKALEYDIVKQRLAIQYFEHRKLYTEGKYVVIEKLLEEARLWRLNNSDKA